MIIDSHILLALYLMIGFQIGGIVFKNFIETSNINFINYVYCFITIPIVWPIVLFLSIFKKSVFHNTLWKDV